MSRRIRNFATLALLLSPLAAEAQSADNVQRGFGLDGFGTIGLDAQGIFSLKAELGYIRYNRKTEPFFASDGFSTFELESETTSGVLMLGAGPQLTMPTGPLRPYIGGSIGFARFATNTSINVPANSSNTGQKETIDQQTVSSDFILSLAASGGLRFELPFLGRGVLADLARMIAADARARGLRAEQMLVALKRDWPKLLERRRVPGEAELSMLSERLVSFCIQEYYVSA